MRGVVQGFVPMRDVKVKREELLHTIRENSQKHIDDYEAAIKGYKKMALTKVKETTDRITKQVESLEEGEMLRTVGYMINLTVPENHAKDYDQVIKMLEMCVEAVVVVGSQEFACYVMDDWDWKEDFRETTRMYGASTT